MTETNSSVVRGSSLVLVTVSPECNDIPPSGLGDGVFFAFPEDNAHHTLIVPESDPRSRGMWSAMSYGADKLPEEGTQYRAWTVSDRYVTVVPVSESETPREVSEAKHLRKGDAFRINNGYGDETQYVAVGDLSETDGLPIRWQHGGNAPLNWGGPGANVPVLLIPENEWTEWTRGKVREILPEESPTGTVTVPESGDSVTLTREELAAQLRDARLAGKRESDEAFEQWKQSANRTAIQYATDNSLCSEFDRCMREIGMLDREEHREQFPDEYDREYSVTVTYTMTVQARDDDIAVEEARGMLDLHTLRHYAEWEAEESY